MLGCYGGHEVLTPHIDSIAEEGLALDEFYTPSAVCTPSRGCFMTGRYPHANGAYRNGVPVGMQEHGFAEAFRLAGYRPGISENGIWQITRKVGICWENIIRLGLRTGRIRWSLDIANP